MISSDDNGGAAAAPLEGKPPSGVVVIKFPSQESIQAFVDDPEYQDLKQLRFSITTDAGAVMAPEFAPRS